MTDIPDDLPPAAWLISLTSQAIAALEDPHPLLDRYAPSIDQLADEATAAQWLGLSVWTVRQEQLESRRRLDGSPGWPAPDETAGKSRMWTFRTIVVHRASMPGSGRQRSRITPCNR